MNKDGTYNGRGETFLGRTEQADQNSLMANSSITHGGSWDEYAGSLIRNCAEKKAAGVETSIHMSPDKNLEIQIWENFKNDRT